MIYNIINHYKIIIKSSTDQLSIKNKDELDPFISEFSPNAQPFELQILYRIYDYLYYMLKLFSIASSSQDGYRKAS